MNPASYENIDNVDWAALAQQWIQMQDIVPPAAPPPPIFTTPGIVTRPIYEEKGEADMEVDMHHSADEPMPHYEAPPSNCAWPPSSLTSFPPPMNNPSQTNPLQWHQENHSHRSRQFNNQPTRKGTNYFHKRDIPDRTSPF